MYSNQVGKHSCIEVCASIINHKQKWDEEGGEIMGESLREKGVEFTNNSNLFRCLYHFLKSLMKWMDFVTAKCQSIINMFSALCKKSQITLSSVWTSVQGCPVISSASEQSKYWWHYSITCRFILSCTTKPCTTSAWHSVAFLLQTW
jgi:hypothetical protein